MSDDLYQVRVLWGGSRGVAKLGPFREPLHAPPAIEGLEFAELDWAPEVRCALIRQRNYGWRDMTREEIRMVDKWLEQRAERG